MAGAIRVGSRHPPYRRQRMLGLLTDSMRSRSILAYGNGKMKHVVVACAYNFPSTSVMVASAIPTRLPT